jgi:hypothetical protein
MNHTKKNRIRQILGSMGKRLSAGFDLFNLAVAARSLVHLRPVLRGSLLLTAAGIMAACSSLAVQPGPPLDPGARWVLLPVANNSETPQAAEKLEAMLATLVRIRGVNNLRVYAPPDDSAAALPVLDDTVRLDQALDWARGRDFEYGITGSVEEWHYKSGVEREPAVGLSLRVLNIVTGQVLWSASGARSGWGRATVSGTAQDLVADMLDTLKLRRPERR